MKRQLIKRIISSILLITFVMTNFLGLLKEAEASAEPLKGGIQREERVEPDNIFTGEVHKVEKNDVIDMTVSQVISGAYSAEGDEFFAEVTRDVKGKGGTVIPIGTVAHGTIKQLGESKRLGRDAWIEVDFDYLITPDGREIPINAKMTTKTVPLKGGAVIAGENLAYTTAGGVVGAATALNLFGIEAAIASHGYTILGGAAVGGVIALGMALFRKGDEVLLTPGDEMKVKINLEMDLPVISEEALKQDEVHYKGLAVKINQVGIEKDPFGERNTYALNLTIDNGTDLTFSSFDIALVDEMRKTYYASVFDDSALNLTKIRPGDRLSGEMSFAVNDLKRKHWLVFYDRRSKKPLTRISVENVLRSQKPVKKKRFHWDKL